MSSSLAAIGRTDKSRFKHHFFWSVLHMLGVLGKCRAHEHPALLDLNAADGHGVRLPGGFFVPEESLSTTGSLMQIAAQVCHTDVMLFEKDRTALDQLKLNFSSNPRVRVFPDNRKAYLHVGDYDYVAAVSDYNGPGAYAGKYGISKYLKMLCREAPADFDLIIIFNEGAVYPLLTEISPDWDKTVQDSFHTNHDWYPQTLDPNYFARELEMPHLAYSIGVFKASGRYAFRVIVLSRRPLGGFGARWKDACKRREQSGYGRRYQPDTGFDKWWDDQDFKRFEKGFKVIK